MLGVVALARLSGVILGRGSAGGFGLSQPRCHLFDDLLFLFQQFVYVLCSHGFTWCRLGTELGVKLGVVRVRVRV